MLTCKQVSKSLEAGDYESLPSRTRLGLKLHVMLCIFCGKYNKQRMIMHDIFRQLRKREDRGDMLKEEHLSEEARSRIKTLLCDDDRPHDAD